MRKVSKAEIVKAVKQLCRTANYQINEDLLDLLKQNRNEESNPIARDVLDTIIENSRMARDRSSPLCQDTGIGIFFVEYGQELCIEGGDLAGMISGAMGQVYREDSLRKSIITEPVTSRVNTGDNLPPIIHWEVVPGNKLKITFLPKGAGAENMSRMKMFKPLTGVEEMIDYVVETVENGGGKPCPPLIIGIGIGGSFDYAPYLAKKALLRPLNRNNQNNDLAEIEKKILERVNDLNIGPLGLGGKTTALAVSIDSYPCHTASLPVAINLQCHSHRHKTVII